MSQDSAARIMLQAQAASRQPNYLSGFMRCRCGAESPISDDPMDPHRWSAKHRCSPPRR